MLLTPSDTSSEGFSGEQKTDEPSSSQKMPQPDQIGVKTDGDDPRHDCSGFPQDITGDAKLEVATMPSYPEWPSLPWQPRPEAPPPSPSVRVPRSQLSIPPFFNLRTATKESDLPSQDRVEGPLLSSVGRISLREQTPCEGDHSALEEETFELAPEGREMDV